jgi:large subunit ribosomal protein L7/L12
LTNFTSSSQKKSKNKGLLDTKKAQFNIFETNQINQRPSHSLKSITPFIINPNTFFSSPLLASFFILLSYLFASHPVAMATTLPSTLSFVAAPSLSSSASPSRSPSSLSFPVHLRRRRLSLSANATVSPKVEEIGTTISNLTLEEARNLVDYLSEKLGVSAAAMAAPVAVAAAPGAGGGDAAAAAAPAEQTEFDVTILEVPSSSRINTIKVIHLCIPADLL